MSTLISCSSHESVGNGKSIKSSTIVMGMIDPDIIRNILRKNTPKFKYCYQKELDRSSSKDASNRIRLLFTISTSGSVSRAEIEGGSRLSSHVKDCFIDTLRAIQFPRPKDGGTVDVKQPFNFYPKQS
jgi:hypothetical protein